MRFYQFYNLIGIQAFPSITSLTKNNLGTLETHLSQQTRACDTE